LNKSNELLADMGQKIGPNQAPLRRPAS
jgi:hypothetical protein